MTQGEKRLFAALVGGFRSQANDLATSINGACSDLADMRRMVKNGDKHLAAPALAMLREMLADDEPGDLTGPIHEHERVCETCGGQGEHKGWSGVTVDCPTCHGTGKPGGDDE